MRRMRGFATLLAVTVSVAAVDAYSVTSRVITTDDRIAAQRAIEEVYWRHRIWPKENPGKKPALNELLSASALRAKVDDYLTKSNALDAIWRHPITAEQLQAELDRIARDSRDRNTLRELFDALGDDPILIAETLARPILADRLVRSWYAGDPAVHGRSGAESFDAWWKVRRTTLAPDAGDNPATLTLPALEPGACAADTWQPTRSEVPERRYSHVAVWTGSEMIVWGGVGGYLHITGGRYDPATDTWAPTSLTNVPSPRQGAKAVWTGTEMIVWGGHSASPTNLLNTGARYDPANDTWTPISIGANVPHGRYEHTAVWTGTEMIVWGGYVGSYPGVSDGGRYNPVADSWAPVSTGPNTPTSRANHVAVWTGTEMIVWGGDDFFLGTTTNTGGRYNPVSDSWVPIATGMNVPAGRHGHVAVWTGTEMIVWGGDGSGTGALKSGGRYDPVTDGWLPTSLGTNVPVGGTGYSVVWTGTRMLVWSGSGSSYDPASDAWTAMAANPMPTGSERSVVWTGTEMIVWGGAWGNYGLNTGARYNPSTNSWVPTALSATVPPGVEGVASIWTGNEMIVWGGYGAGGYVNTGGAYNPATDSWTPTSLAGAPPGKEYSTAIWTGFEMIVWGGRPGANSGGRFDPITNSWLPTSAESGVPTPRERQTAVWTGREMIVWGGGGAFNTLLNTGGRYDPSTDSWRPTSIGANVPAPRIDHAAVWTGTEMIVWGGGVSPNPFMTNTGGRYDPSTDSWAPTSVGANVSEPRESFSTIWTGSEMIVWGGTNVWGAYLNSGARYVPVSDTWVPMSIGTDVPSARAISAAVWTGSDMIVFGGANYSTLQASGGGRYSLSSNAWSPMTDWAYVGHTLAWGAAVWTGRQMIVWGGDPQSALGGLYCACPSGALFYRDADGDGYGDAGVSAPSCDGTPPAGYVADATDCNDAATSTHPGTAELCNGIDDDCDGVVDGGDADSDRIAGACDNCPTVANETQSDFDHDGEGDACDLNDGEIWQWRDDKASVSWQEEQGPTAWNVYTGDLAVLRATGVYTQTDRQCGLASPAASDLNDPAPGSVTFTLVTGVTGGVEGSLGNNSSGPRPNTNPCP